MIPYGEIDTVFLDVGNTLISIDFDWVARELSARNAPCVADALRRAEAKARPAYAERIFVDGIPEGTDLLPHVSGGDAEGSRRHVVPAAR